MESSSLLATNWNPKDAGDRVLAGLTNVCAPEVKGAHDSDFVIAGRKAYIVYEANEVQPGEGADWPFIYMHSVGGRYRHPPGGANRHLRGTGDAVR